MSSFVPPRREELVEKICLLESYIITLEKANQCKYQEICFQNQIISQLNHDISNLKLNKASLYSPSLNEELEHSLQASSELCIQLQIDNQHLKRKLADLQNGRVTRSRSKDTRDLSFLKQSTVRRATEKGRRDSIIGVFTGAESELKRPNKYSFDNTPESSKTSIQTREFQGDLLASSQSDTFNQGRIFSFSNLHESETELPNPERFLDNQESRDFRKLTYESYREFDAIGNISRRIRN